MVFEAPRQKMPESLARTIAQELIARLGTDEVACAFRTASGSVYAADEQARTVRFRATSKTYEPPSNITVFLDHKYLDPDQTDRGSAEYLKNFFMNEAGGLVLFEKDKPPREIHNWSDLDDVPDESKLNDLYFVGIDRVQIKIKKKAPVSLVPMIGMHPVEFCDPDTHRLGHRNHVGDQITDIAMTNALPVDERLGAIQVLATKSVSG